VVSAQLVLQALAPSQAKAPQDVTSGVHSRAALHLKTASIDAEQVAGMQVVSIG
jgi:hypothetical protein